MKIGILTFHWATNYGAVLQCYALQTYLESIGYNVEVINYKPKRYDDTIYTLFRFRKFLHIGNYIENRKKESALILFRKQKLKISKRYSTYKDMSNSLDGYSAIISGSDQVLNPSFFMHGEGKNVETPTYFLGFQFKGKRIGYALSFGCVSYPQRELILSSKYINAFDFISVREKTGIDIVASMGRNDAVLVPDPTLLMESKFYHQLTEDSSLFIDSSYVYCFFIRHIKQRKLLINAAYSCYKKLWNNEDGDYTLQGWLCKIKHAEFVITDSFHCMVMCMKFHIPFAVITEYVGNIGMNDRFYTLLEKMSLELVIKNKSEIDQLCNISKDIYDWNKVDRVLDECLSVGRFYLNDVLS